MVKEAAMPASAWILSADAGCWINGVVATSIHGMTVNRSLYN